MIFCEPILAKDEEQVTRPHSNIEQSMAIRPEKDYKEMVEAAGFKIVHVDRSNEQPGSLVEEMLFYILKASEPVDIDPTGQENASNEAHITTDFELNNTQSVVFDGSRELPLSTTAPKKLGKRSFESFGNC